MFCMVLRVAVCLLHPSFTDPAEEGAAACLVVLVGPVRAPITCRIEHFNRQQRGRHGMHHTSAWRQSVARQAGIHDCLRAVQAMYGV